MPKGVYDRKPRQPKTPSITTTQISPVATKTSKITPRCAAPVTGNWMAQSATFSMERRGVVQKFKLLSLFAGIGGFRTRP